MKKIIAIKRRFYSRRFERLCEKLYYTEAIKKIKLRTQYAIDSSTDPVKQRLDIIQEFLYGKSNLYIERFNLESEDYSMLVNTSYQRAYARINK